MEDKPTVLQRLKRLYPDKKQKPTVLLVIWSTVIDFGWLFVLERIILKANNSDPLDIAPADSNIHFYNAVRNSSIAADIFLFLKFVVLEFVIWWAYRYNYLKKKP